MQAFLFLPVLFSSLFLLFESVAPPLFPGTPDLPKQIIQAPWPYKDRHAKHLFAFVCTQAQSRPPLMGWGP